MAAALFFGGFGSWLVVSLMGLFNMTAAGAVIMVVIVVGGPMAIEHFCGAGGADHIKYIKERDAANVNALIAVLFIGCTIFVYALFIGDVRPVNPRVGSMSKLLVSAMFSVPLCTLIDFMMMEAGVWRRWESRLRAEEAAKQGAD